jgi:hypothetical protein
MKGRNVEKQGWPCTEFVSVVIIRHAVRPLLIVNPMRKAPDPEVREPMPGKRTCPSNEISGAWRMPAGFTGIAGQRAFEIQKDNPLTTIKMRAAGFGFPG